ncbi:MAG: DUF86 domain-containing protein [Candidatus Yanofskybacteria bacterium]|nr:DUF86 domain-containing protein [Candidatus Yanofskybacteria bacterium]
MDKANDLVYISHILDATKLIKEFVAGKSLQEFEKEPMRFSAVVRQLEVIGEAAKRLSIETKEDASDLPWRKITGMRDFLIHDYIEVDLKEVWKAATEDVPELARELEKYKNLL